jgi:hypothetical protein
MHAIQVFHYEATLENRTIAATVECGNIVEALQLVNGLHAKAESITVKKIKKNNVRLYPILF